MSLVVSVTIVVWLMLVVLVQLAYGSADTHDQEWW